MFQERQLARVSKPRSGYNGQLRGIIRVALGPSLLDSILERLAKREGRDCRGGDRHLLTRLGIASLALRPLLGRERAETHQRHLRETHAKSRYQLRMCYLQIAHSGTASKLTNARWARSERDTGLQRPKSVAKQWDDPRLF